MKRQIGEICEVYIGYQFRKKVEMVPNGTHLVIQIKDINDQNDHRLDVSNLIRVSLDTDPAKFEVNNGDVIFQAKGSRNYASLVENLPTIFKIIASGVFYILRPNKTLLNPAYLVWAINQPSAQNQISVVRRGTYIPFIPKEGLTNIVIDIPPREIQDKIVKLHQLSVMEGDLLKKLEQLRQKLISGICQKAAHQK